MRRVDISRNNIPKIKVNKWEELIEELRCDAGGGVRLLEMTVMVVGKSQWGDVVRGDVDGGGGDGGYEGNGGEGGSYPVSVAKQVVNHAEYANSIHLVKDKLSLQVILGTDDETSLNDDTSSNDEISLSEDLINYLSGRDVEWQLPKNTQEEPPKPHYAPIKTEVEEPLPLDIVYPHSHVASIDMDEFPADDEMFLEIDEVVFKIHTKGYFEYDPLRKKSLVKGAMVNGKAKMVEDVGAVKRGKDRGVVIEDGGFINDGGKETVVTKRAIGSRKMEGKSVKVESE
ncbi:hypothetical protein Tco_0218249 [Tanacetum coccineum]